MLNNRIKEMRIEKRMTQDEIADAAGVSVKTLQRYEAGQSTPSAKKIEALAARNRSRRARSFRTVPQPSWA